MPILFAPHSIYQTKSISFNPSQAASMLTLYYENTLMTPPPPPPSVVLWFSICDFSLRRKERDIYSNVIRRGVYGNLALRTKDEHHGMQLFKGTVSRDFICSSDAFPHAEIGFLKARSDEKN
jgi:hypothetical protein